MFSDLIDAKRILREIKLLHHLGKHENIIELWVELRQCRRHGCVHCSPGPRCRRRSYDLMTYPPETEDFRDLYIVTELFECDLDRIISSSQPLTDGATHSYRLGLPAPPTASRGRTTHPSLGSRPTQDTFSSSSTRCSAPSSGSTRPTCSTATSSP